LLSTGQFIEADKAEELGLINHAVAHDALADAAQELARTVASKLGSAVKIGKRGFYEQLTLPLEQAYEHAGDIMAQNMLYRETEEGIAAFLEKRDPTWTQ